MSRIGRMIGGYRITRRLGEGGMSVVWLGENSALRKRVAIKCFKDGFIDQTGRARFLDEARIQFGLKHKNIAQVENLSEDPLAIIMEYAAGGSLTERLAAGPAPLDEILEWFRQICAGVGAAHDAGIVHRDLKPDNILLKGDTIKVTDFGLARWLGSVRHTQQGNAVGTPIYMAPEQALGVDEPTSQTDVYALGVLLYELLVGQPPFRRTNGFATLNAHVHEAPPAIPAGLGTPPLRAVIMRALEKRAADRYADANALWAALAVIAQPEPTALIHIDPSIADALSTPYVESPRGTRRLPSIPPTMPSRARKSSGTHILPVQPADGPRMTVADNSLPPVARGPNASMDSATIIDSQSLGPVPFRPEAIPASSPTPKSRSRWLIVGLFALLTLIMGAWAVWPTGEAEDPVAPGPVIDVDALYRQLSALIETRDWDAVDRLAGEAQSAGVRNERIRERRAIAVRERDNLGLIKRIKHFMQTERWSEAAQAASIFDRKNKASVYTGEALKLRGQARKRLRQSLAVEALRAVSEGDDAEANRLRGALKAQPDAEVAVRLLDTQLKAIRARREAAKLDVLNKPKRRRPPGRQSYEKKSHDSLVKSAQRAIVQGRSDRAVALLSEARALKYGSIAVPRILCGLLPKEGLVRQGLRNCKRWRDVENDPNAKAAAIRKINQLMARINTPKD